MTELQTRPLAELEQLPQWVVWRYEERKGNPKPTKILYNPTTGHKAKANDSRTWGTYCAASNAHLFGLNKNEYDGIGFVFTVDDTYFGIDLDACIDGDGKVADWAAEIIDRFGSYWETSVSGRGLHCIAKGRIPDEYRTGAGTGRRKGGLEVYDNGRYFTVSEAALNDSPVKDCQPALDAMMAEMFTPAPSETHTVDATLADAMAVDIEPLLRQVDACPRLRDLWNEPATTDQSKHDYKFTLELLRAMPDISDAEAMALVSELRRESGDKPEKAEREDYLRSTVASARSKIAGGLQAFDDVSADPAPAVPAGETEQFVSHVRSPADFAGKRAPAREWLVEGLIPHGTVTLLSGDGGLGKSLLLQQLATDAALGRDWLGIKTRACRTFALFCEDSDDELWRRQENICSALMVGLDDVRDFRWVTGEHIPTGLMSFEGNSSVRLTRTYHLLRAYLETFRPELVIIDTAADTFEGEENTRYQVRAFIRDCLGRLCSRLNATIVLSAHPSVAGMASGSGFSGSTAWNNSVRSRLYLERSKGVKSDIRRTLSSKKSNYGPAGLEVSVEWRDGVFTTTGGVSVLSTEEVQLVDRARFITALRELLSMDRAASNHTNQSNFAPKLISKLDAANGTSKSRLVDAMEALMAGGVIEAGKIGDGPDSRKRKSLIIRDVEKADAIVSEASLLADI